MADNNPNFPGGSPPPRPSDSKVLPKKETVRINLPPKPSAAPTIKLPTLPPGGPGAMGSSQAPAAPAPAPRATAAPATAAPAQRQAPASRQQTRPAAAAAQTVSGLDKGLAIAAAIAVLVAVGSTVFLLTQSFPPAVGL